MTSSLTAKSCTPCRGGVPPLTVAEAAAYLPSVSGWELIENGTKIQQTFKFKDFKGSLDFVHKVGALAESEFHHPDMSFGWGFCTVALRTKKIKGLHENDFIMAAKINALAEV